MILLSAGVYIRKEFFYTLVPYFCYKLNERTDVQINQKSKNVWKIEFHQLSTFITTTHGYLYDGDMRRWCAVCSAVWRRLIYCIFYRYIFTVLLCCTSSATRLLLLLSVADKIIALLAWLSFSSGLLKLVTFCRLIHCILISQDVQSPPNSKERPACRFFLVHVIKAVSWHCYCTFHSRAV